MEIVYAAHTQSGVFMLDADGVCRWAVGHSGRTGLGCAERVPERIVGAQYLATLDVTADGALVDLPRVGCPMLFAATDPVTGRVRLVRTPPLLRFEDRRNAPTRRPLASKFDFEEVASPPTPTPRMPYDEEKTPARPSSIPPPMSQEAEPIQLTRPITTSGIVPAPPGISRHTPLPPPPRARIAARIPPAPSTVPSLSSATAALRDARGVKAIPVRTRAANMTLKKLARGK
jgi:hypothetical protein